MNENPTSPDEQSEAEWLRSMADAGVPPSARTRFAEESLPPLVRERPVRRPLIPSRVIWSVLGVVGAVFLAVAITAVILASSVTSTPNVVGLDADLASTDLAREGLSVKVAGQQFSTEPTGRILKQDPPAGSDLKKPGVIEVIVSAGTEEFLMPDVIGNGMSLALGSLKSRGLVVQIETVVSDQASDTVLSTTPAPGVTIRTGDVVRIQVASPRTDGGGLVPFRMDGITVRIDPAPVKDQPVDVTLEIARRLGALLEASGAKAIILRSTAAPMTDAARASAATESSATISVGLSVAASGPVGRVVSSPPSMTAPIGPASEALAELVETALSTSAPPARRLYAQSDTVFNVTGEPWVRVVVGSTTMRADTTSFADPRWADTIARAVYSALGQVYGQRVGP